MDNLFFAEEARPIIMRGVEKCARAVGITMGTAGLNSVIEDVRQPKFDLTNDGIYILENIKLENRLEEMGRNMLLEAVSQANKKSGDGSSTTCVLTAAILEEGIKHLGETSAMEIKRSLEACIPLIEESIKKQSKQITVDEVWQTASISAEDEEIGKRIGEIYQKIGKDGVINWEAAKVPEDSYEIGTGIKMSDSGYLTPYLNDVDAATGWFKNEARLKNVPVILCAQKITNLDALGGLFKLLNDKGESDVALFAEEITPEVVGQLIATRQKRGFRVVVIKMPTLWKNEWWEDLSLASGATVISSAIGIPLNSIEESHVGRFGNVIVGRDEVVIDDMKDLMLHIAKLQTGSDDEKARAFRLNLKTARYFVGGHSESGISHRRRKVEDAINAASEALDGGVVPGGGIALRNTAWEFLDGVGGQILQQATQAPFREICKNAGITEALEESDRATGFDTRTGKVVNMFEVGIVDPAKVVLSAVKAAIGVASGILTLGTVVLLPREEQPQSQQSLIVR